MTQKTVVHVVFVLTLVAAAPAHGDVAGKAIREAVEFAAKKFGKEVAEEGAERLTGKLVQLSARFGDDVVAAAVKRVGPRAGRIAGEAGENAGTALRLLGRYGDDAAPIVARSASLNAVARYGDDAATALIRHGAVGEELVEKFAKEGVEALARVTPQNGRRLAILAKEGNLNPELVSVVTRYGDEACALIWKNKGSLAVAATLATFIASPGEFLDGTKSLTEAVGETVVSPLAEAVARPLAEVPKVIATEAARTINWTALAVVTVVVAGMAAGAWAWKARSIVRVLKALMHARPERKPETLD